MSYLSQIRQRSRMHHPQMGWRISYGRSPTVHHEIAMCESKTMLYSPRLNPSDMEAFTCRKFHAPSSFQTVATVSKRLCRSHCLQRFSWPSRGLSYIQLHPRRYVSEYWTLYPDCFSWTTGPPEYLLEGYSVFYRISVISGAFGERSRVFAGHIQLAGSSLFSCREFKEHEFIYSHLEWNEPERS